MRTHGFERDRELDVAAERLAAECVDLEDILKVATLAGEKFTARLCRQSNPDREAQLAEWARLLVHHALRFELPGELVDLDAAYWIVVGGHPMSRAEWDKRIGEAKREALSQGSDDLWHILESTEYVDRTDEAEHVTRTALRVVLTSIHAEQVEQEAERVLSMYRLAASTSRLPRIRELLARVARLYILGMDIEVAALARAALEAVLIEAVPDDTVRRYSPAPPEGRITLGARIRSARRLGLLDQTGEEYARIIQARGNQSLHEGMAPLKQIGGPYGIIGRLAYCLRQVELGSEAGGTG